MWLLNIIAFLIVTIYVAHKTKENMTEIFPVTACGLIFILYVLAYFRCLSWIDGISLGIIGYSILSILRSDKVKRRERLVKTKDLLCQPVTLTVFISCVVISLLVQYVGAGVCLFLLPSVVETFYLEGSCSDLPMGIAYGLFLWSVIDERNHNVKFSYVRQSFALALVMICKNTGFQWVIYGLLFWLVYHWFMYKEEEKGIFLRFIGNF